MPDLSIIIPTLNNVRDLAPCLESVRRTTRVSHEILVYANACTPETADFLEREPGIRPILDERNAYFTEAVNRAIAQARGRYVFLLNDDTVIRRDDWFDVYRHHLELDPSIAVAGPYWKNIDELPYGWIEPYATLYRRSIFEQFGGLPFHDESFVLWWSDIYHAYTLMKAGYHLRPLARPVVDSLVYHRRVGESGATVLKLKPRLPRECFAFHGKDLMYRRLGIAGDDDLAGYFEGEVFDGACAAVAAS